MERKWTQRPTTLRGVGRIALVSPLLTSLLFVGCKKDEPDAQATPVLEGDESDWASIEIDGNSLTYYEDILPIVEEKCLHCHQEDGIGAMDLSTYEVADEWATAIAAQVGGLLMPPFLMRRGGDAGIFDESETLSDEQIATIVAWAKSDRAEGTPRAASVPKLPSLEGATELVLPEFTPEIVGGDYALFDEYRCFRVDVDPGNAPYISGYDVIPGNPSLVHHVVGFTVDTTLYGERMDELDAESPDRPGWPCFGATGEGVEPSTVPITWAPGQGVVEFPAKSGVKLNETETLVFQVHYNMADPDVIGQSDQTTIQLRFSQQSELERQATFLLPDPFLDSVFTGEPEELEPGKASVKYSWSLRAAQLFEPIATLGQIDIVALGPHMHEYGRKMTIVLTDSDGNKSIIGHTDRWDFNWQKIYHYEEFPVLEAGSTLEVICDYDTRAATEPVQAGWGTRNEMCLPMMVVTLPPGVFL